MIKFIDYGTKLKVYFDNHYVGTIQRDSSGFYVFISAYDTIVMSQSFMEEIVNKLSELNTVTIQEFMDESDAV